MHQADADEFGFIVDYSPTITPVIGKAKPNNFFLEEKRIWISIQILILFLSRGQTSCRNYGIQWTTFGYLLFRSSVLSQKLSLESLLLLGYDEGKYVFGVDSGAYGVVEGTPSGVYTTGTILLYVRTLSGRFLSGETIRDEDGNTVRIARENTISHFVVQNRGLGYADGVTLLINGQEYDSSKIELFKAV